MAWFLRLSIIPNTTQYSTFYFFYYSIIFPHLTYINYFSFLIIFSCLFLTIHVFCHLNFYTSYFKILSHLHLHFYIYVLPSYLFVTSVSYSSTNVAVPLIKFWVSNFSIRFFFSSTGTLICSFLFFSFFFFLLWFFGLQNTNLFWF